SPHLFVHANDIRDDAVVEGRVPDGGLAAAHGPAAARGKHHEAFHQPGAEAVAAQHAAQPYREVEVVDLPFERLAARLEVRELLADHGVGVVAAEAREHHEAFV